MNIVVEARHMDVTDAIRSYAESKAARLERFYDRLRLIGERKAHFCRETQRARHVCLRGPVPEQDSGTGPPPQG